MVARAFTFGSLFTKRITVSVFERCRENYVPMWNGFLY